MLFTQKECDKIGPGVWHVGENLFLIKKIGSNGDPLPGWWEFRYKFARRAHSMGLGSTSEISLSQAKKLALKHRLLLDKGIDPLENRRRKKQCEKQKKKKLAAIKIRNSRYKTLKKNEPPWWAPGGVHNEWTKECKRAKDADRRREARANAR